MNDRERMMAMGLLGVIVLGVGAFAGYFLVLSPLEANNAAIRQLEQEIAGTAEKPGLEEQAAALRKTLPQVAAARRQSLPPAQDIARTQYQLLLERLLHKSGITDYKIPEATTLDSRPPITPEIAPKKPIYTRLQFHVDMTKVDIWQVTDFLYEFYEMDLLHQITELKIVRTNKTTDSRKGLEVHLNIEAIMLDGADARTALFPVLTARGITPAGEAVAAVGGLWGVRGVNANVELGRRVTADPTTPVLAVRSRDYSLLAQRDIFYGPLPPDKAPPALSVGRISDLTLKQGDKIPDVPVKLSGAGAETAVLEAKAAGPLLPEGKLEVDAKTHTIRFPSPYSDVSEGASATISLVATSSDGKSAKSSFKVALERSTTAEKEDIASAIKLIIVSTNSEDGTATAVIRDSFNPFRYEVKLADKTFEVVKWYPRTLKQWGKDPNYEEADGVLAISDETSNTKKSFKVVAILDHSLILTDYVKPETRKPAARKDATPPKKEAPAAATVKKEVPEPLSMVTGNLAVALPAPALYRWENGKALNQVEKLSPAEARLVMQRVAAEGILGSTVSARKE
jgi:hypothetical protein